MVSFGSTSPALSDRSEFPLFYRTVAPDSSHNPARLAFVRGFGWDTVTALSQNEDVYSLAVNDLVTELEEANITCRATITFAESDFRDQLLMLKDLDTRIIIGSFSHEVAPKIFCEAYQLGMYGSDYAWILQGGPSDVWWENVTECPQHHLAAAVEGLLLVSSHNSIVGVMPSHSGLTNSRFLEEFELLSLPVTRFAPQTYDAVWAIALALHGAQEKWERNNLHLSVHQFDYNRGEVCKVALFYPSSDHMDFSCPDCKPLVWQGGQVPIAKRVFKLRVVTIEPAAFLSITCLALIGITIAVAFLAFNLHFRKLKYIKLSSPRLNNMAVVGCILVYTAVILLGLDHATLPTNSHFSAVCTVEVCRSQYTHGWLGALYGYKGLLLIVGVYMAWETRHVKIPALNDSQYIGMSVYSVVITSGIVVVLANLISERATLAFVTITTLILTSTTATLCLLFLPKLHAILGHADDNGDPIMHSMGLKIEYNTRRFVTDDRRELYYRVEVQNRVYHRDLAALNLEIGRLKQQLIESPPSSSDSVSEGIGSKKTDLSPDEKGSSKKKSVVDALPSSSIGGGLPLLLLSVLPPVIPRASWPSADHANLSMRRQVTFSSEPKLDDTLNQQSPSGREEYYITCEDQEDDSEGTTKLGVLSRIKNFLGSRPSSRKTSTASFSGTTGGIASALRAHVGYLTGLVPSSNAATSYSCNTSVTALNQYGLCGMQTVATSSRELHPLKQYCGRVGGGSGPIISVTSNDDPEKSIYLDGDEDFCNANRRKFSLGMCLSHKEDKDFKAAERRVSYSSVQKKGTFQHQHSQPVLSFRERAKGSPRFPHKIVPTCSLNALEDRRRSSSPAGVTSYSANPSGSNLSYLARRQSSHHHLHVSSRLHGHLGGKCRSLEDATSIHKGAGPSVVGCNAHNWKPRAASYSPNCDVWATAEFGIPLSELGNSSRYKDKNVPSTSVQRRDSQCS
ncbi:hypothetical protein C0J52_02179 [Blattella germanica]|nr:hypothetical protein C0J52_02179 [Blattella germanica]